MRLDMPSESAFEPEHVFTSVHSHRSEDDPVRSGLLPSYVFSTQLVPAREQFETYCAELSDFGRPALPDGVTPASGFRAERAGYDLGPLRMLVSSSDAYSFGKPIRQVPRIHDHWVLVLRRKGWAEIDFDGNQRRLEGRHLELFPMANPRSGRVGANESTFLHLPRAQFAGMEAMLDSIAHMGCINYVHPLLSDYVSTLSGLLPNITSAEAALAAESTIAMVRACTSHSAEAIEIAQSPIMATRFELARRYIEENLRSPDLTPEAIQTKLAVSRRQLYKIFEMHGGPAHYVRSRRLGACHAAIADPNDKRSIGAIAAAYSFADTAQFSRQFRTEFGYSASEARDSGRARQPSRSGFLEWVTRIV
jgi:AraC-like DNA-binding protein